VFEIYRSNQLNWINLVVVVRLHDPLHPSATSVIGKRQKKIFGYIQSIHWLHVQNHLRSHCPNEKFADLIILLQSVAELTDLLSPQTCCFIFFLILVSLCDLGSYRVPLQLSNIKREKGRRRWEDTDGRQAAFPMEATRSSASFRMASFSFVTSMEHDSDVQRVENFYWR